MGVDAGIELVDLANGFADGAVRIEPVHGDAARSVVGGEQVLAGGVDAHMDRPRDQRLRRPVRQQ